MSEIVWFSTKDRGRSDDGNRRQQPARDFLPVAKNVSCLLRQTCARTHTHPNWSRCPQVTGLKCVSVCVQLIPLEDVLLGVEPFHTWLKSTNFPLLLAFELLTFLTYWAWTCSTAALIMRALTHTHLHTNTHLFVWGGSFPIKCCGLVVGRSLLLAVVELPDIPAIWLKHFFHG